MEEEELFYAAKRSLEDHLSQTRVKVSLHMVQNVVDHYNRQAQLDVKTVNGVIDRLWNVLRDD